MPLLYFISAEGVFSSDPQAPQSCPSLAPYSVLEPLGHPLQLEPSGETAAAAAAAAAAAVITNQPAEPHPAFPQ